MINHKIHQPTFHDKSENHPSRCFECDFCLSFKLFEPRNCQNALKGALQQLKPGYDSRHIQNQKKNKPSYDQMGSKAPLII
jgi:hypothetical protein